MTNCNPDTGIRYGVIAMNSLDSDLAHELWYGPQATNASEEEAYAEAKRELEAEYDAALEEAHIAAAEVDYNQDTDAFVERWMDTHGFGDCREGYVDQKLQWVEFQIDEPVISGTYQGVQYTISWLGGAPLLWVFEGPEGSANRLCSPCVPNAADLDGGFKLDAETPIDVDGYPMEDQEGYPCYCVPRDWLAKEVS
jgi:hypothetical protein